jgi:hypothetical protein
MPRLRAMLLLSLAASLFVPGAFAQNTNNARPGTINYVEGEATLNGQALTSHSVGSAEVGAGQTVETAAGKAEVLLTPGVFLRLGDHSAMTMVSPDLTRTEVQVDRGTAEVEVDQLYKQNDLLVDQGPAQTVLLKDGLYEFDANAKQVRVFDGEASVSPAQNSKQWIRLKDHHELALTGEAVKPADFDAKEVAEQDPLYSWSKLRADYLGQANLSMAETYAGNPGFYPGWMWDPWAFEYTWLPYNGLFWSPFGYGFYSPWYLYGGGFVYPAYGFGGFYYHGGYGVHGPYRGVPATGYRGGVATAPASRGSGGGGFRGGFSGGGGGFHGGGGRR